MSHLEIKTLETSTDVHSAGIAYDYLRGAIRKHFESFLNCNITDWRKRKVIPIWDETLREIVEKSSHTYNDSPKRQILDDSGEVNVDKSTAYFDIIGDQEFGFVPMQDEFDQLRRCLGTALVLVTYITEVEKINFNILSRNNCQVKFNRDTKQIEELMYTSGCCGRNGGKLFHLWTETEIIDIEFDDDIEEIVGREPNPYGRVPVAYAYDAYKPLYTFWTAPRWETLVTLNDTTSLSYTETKHAKKFQEFPSLFTNVKLPQGMVLGADAIHEITDTQGLENIYLEYKAPPNVAQSVEVFEKWLAGMKSSIAAQWGVNIRAEGTGSADSGFKLIVEELPNTEIRIKRIGTAESFEARLHSAVETVAAYHQIADISGTFKAEFEAPRLPVNKKEDAEITVLKLSTNVWDLEDAWKHENPEITEEELLKKRARVDAKVLGSAAGSLSDFSEV